MTDVDVMEATRIDSPCCLFREKATGLVHMLRDWPEMTGEFLPVLNLEEMAGQWNRAHLLILWDEAKKQAAKTGENAHAVFGSLARFHGVNRGSFSEFIAQWSVSVGDGFSKGARNADSVAIDHARAMAADAQKRKMQRFWQGVAKIRDQKGKR